MERQELWIRPREEKGGKVEGMQEKRKKKQKKKEQHFPIECRMEETAGGGN